MGVMRLGYVHVRVTDLDEARKHYGETVGLNEVAADGNTVWYKGWDEWDHHSVVLEEGGVGLVKLGFKVRFSEDLDRFESAAQRFGLPTTRFAKGDNREVGDGFSVSLLGHQVDFYHDMTYVGTDVGTFNPMSAPRHLRGIGAPFLDHMLIKGDDVETAERFFVDVLDFAPVERMVASLDDGAPLIATWLSCSSKTHDIALIKGEDGGLHHFTFQLRDWNKVQDAGDILVMDDVPIDIGPTRHGITRGETIYFFDPAGNRNEVFAGGYNFNYDRPCVTWTMDQLPRGLDYYAREAKDTFLTVYT
ncbi:MAG: catechol 2,3-dioxygenase [Candidatus Nanopelagicales bacterium]